MMTNLTQTVGDLYENGTPKLTPTICSNALSHYDCGLTLDGPLLAPSNPNTTLPSQVLKGMSNE